MPFSKRTDVANIAVDNFTKLFSGTKVVEKLIQMDDTISEFSILNPRN